MPITTEQKAIYESIDEILWTHWDPIGVNDIEDARDEYQNYTPTIFSLRINGADKETIAKKLFEIETKTIGLLGNIENCREVAEQIVNIN
ncbi:MAG TPA: hypothetical protein VF691_04530 [Cytophagaceae bacterium]|jgi:hypothetical protein